VAPRILLVEDDPTIHRHLRDALAGEGYEIGEASDGAEALAELAGVPPDLVLLDLGLPDMDGVDLCRIIRQTVPGTTIVVLTARDEEIDVIVGLDAGADDYLSKPFRLAELLARVRAHLRRAGSDADADDAPIVVEDLQVDRAARKVFIAGDELALRPKEFDLLVLLAAQAGRAVTRERIMSEVWDEHWFGSTKTLDMHISALRRKLGPGVGGKDRIDTLRGVGYRYATP
jgi:DNA-binding response OmpR family regulator